MIPYCADVKQAREDLHKQKMQEGPAGILTLRAPGPPNMGGSMALSILFNLGVALFVAYLTGRTLPVGAHHLALFRAAGTLGRLRSRQSWRRCRASWRGTGGGQGNG